MVPLRAALEAERAGRMLESFRLCADALRAVPDDADALNLMGRLCGAGGDAVAAIGFQRHALLVDPEHTRARADLDRALAPFPSRASGDAAFAAACELRPDIAAHHLAPGTLPAFPALDRARALLDEAVALNPGNGAAHAALGNVLARTGAFAEALAAYRRAVLLEPDAADAQLATAEIEYNFDDLESARYHYANAFARCILFSTPAPQGARRSVLVLARPAPGSANVPLDFVVDHERIAIHRLYLPNDDTAALSSPLPSYDLIFNAVSESEAAAGAVGLAAQFIDSQSKPVFNHPRNLWKTARPSLAPALRDVPHCIVPQTRRLARDVSLDAASFPLLARPIDSHAGRDLERVENNAELAAYIADRPSEPGFDVTEYVEYRSADGYYRKYRIMFVDGLAYPYHLAISPNWMIHYKTSAMFDCQWMRDEEAAFLNDPGAVFPYWIETMEALAAAIGLDYFGIDAARTDGGELLVFEADAATFVHAKDSPERFPYKPPAVARIVAAVGAMFERALTPRE